MKTTNYPPNLNTVNQSSPLNIELARKHAITYNYNSGYLCLQDNYWIHQSWIPGDREAYSVSADVIIRPAPVEAPKVKEKVKYAVYPNAY